MFHVCMLKNINKEIQKWNIDYAWLKPAYWHFSCVICQLMHNVHSHHHPEQFYKQSVMFSPFSGKKKVVWPNAMRNSFFHRKKVYVDHSCEGKNLKAGWYNGPANLFVEYSSAFFISKWQSMTTLDQLSRSVQISDDRSRYCNWYIWYEIVIYLCIIWYFLWIQLSRSV